MVEKLSPAFFSWLVDLRRELHRMPELSFREKKTAAKICDVLESLDVPYEKGIAETGVLARIKARAKGPKVAFRADMDALPLDEDPAFEFRSQHDGCMHACGHDAHMAIEEMVKGLETGFGVRASCEIIEGYPVMENHLELSAFMETCVRECFGESRLARGLPSMGAEDFGYFSRKWPGVMVGIGCHNPEKGFEHGLHSPFFRLDERALAVGVRLFTHAIATYLRKAGGV